jgi:hypothetical protein
VNHYVRIEGKQGTKQGWVWNWRNEPDYDSRQPALDYKGRRSKALVEFHLGRGGKIPSTFLADWFGSLVCDGHRDYSPGTIENGITRAGCWAHVRRPFRLVVADHPKWAALPFFLINRLFSLMLPCKQDSVNPEADLTDVLMAVATTPSSQMSSLTPRAWREAKAPAE